MALFDIFKKPKFDIDVRDDGIYVNGASCEFDTDKLLGALGKPRVIEDEKGALYFWDEAGIWGFFRDGKIIEIRLTAQVLKGTKHEMPRRLYASKFSINGKPPLDAVPQSDLRGAYISFEIVLGSVEILLTLSDAVQEGINKFSFAERFNMKDTDELANIVLSAKEPVASVIIVPRAPKVRQKRVKSNKFKLPQVSGEVLDFENFNLKLAVLNELMYEKELLKPKFDVYEFCRERGICKDLGFGALKQAKKWFKDYPIPAHFADEICELFLDGGNEIYLQVAPQWDGEDDLFAIKNLSQKDIALLPNLRKIEDNGGFLGKKAAQALRQNGVEVIG